MIQELFQLKRKVVFITGASSGIGKSMAELFAAEGANLILCARRKDRIEALSNELRDKYRIDCIPVCCDITKEAEVKEAVKQAVDVFGRIEILINNAGTTEKSEDVVTHTTEQWHRVLETNLTGAFTASREVVKYMKENKYGKIINISSVCGLMGLANQVGYAATKSGLIGLTRAMAVELGKYNITVNAIAPGYFLTELTNETSRGCQYFKSRTVTNTIGKPEDLFGTVLLLATDASSYITGAVIPVDGGITASI